jgi:7-cyano-7-deazaguanine synthase
MKDRAVVLLSGGLDSATTLYIAGERGYECHALTFDYGQRHKREIAAAKSVAAKAGCAHDLLPISLPWGGSSLVDMGVKLPKERQTDEIGSVIPSTYVPGRNMIFLSFAVSMAEAIGARKVFIGANAVDYSGYPDCRPVFIDAFNSVIKEGTKSGAEGSDISVEAPLLSMTKAQIIDEGVRLGVPYEHTWSCYEGKDAPCGGCDSCILRKRGFKEAGVVDPIKYIHGRCSKG